MTRLIAVIFLGWVLGLQTAQATPIRYDFSQTGFSGGAEVTGFFLGDDLDGNGQLSSFRGEVSGFQLNFSGNSWVHGFSLDLSDLLGLVYDLDGGILGDGSDLDGEGMLAWDWNHLFAAGVGPLGLECGQDPICGGVASHHHLSLSGEAIMVTAQVPEPAMGLLFMLGFVGLVWARRKSRQTD